MKGRHIGELACFLVEFIGCFALESEDEEVAASKHVSDEEHGEGRLHQTDDVGGDAWVVRLKETEIRAKVHHAEQPVCLRVWFVFFVFII